MKGIDAEGAVLILKMIRYLKDKLGPNSDVVVLRMLVDWLRKGVDEKEREEEQSSVRWWPQSVECSCCEKIELEGEPDCYVVMCPRCGETVMVKPI